ncbi:MAG: nucleotidyl transferase AbiEii/AbiGii toxin family protein [Acidimicrobiaceae bacterium]|nr:nucleotidyl transferase AbiEii/AbiGii toxin family protein [Acidimicrobiaceae bacterium]
MNWLLRESPDALAAGAARVARTTGIPMAHVEKDFWITEALRGVARCSINSGVSIVFKGGTSLSKAFGLIQRFSEDVDVIVITPGRSTGQDDRCLKSFVTAAEISTGLKATVDPRTATRGVKRTARLEYPTDTAAGVLRQGVLLELGVRGGAIPTVQRSVRSLLVEHSIAAGLETDFKEAEAVTLHVLAPVRTLVEKLIIVHHAALKGGAAEQARHARHYYDI